MKKSCLPLLVMSIISLLVAASEAIYVVNLMNDRSLLGTVEETHENAIALTLARVAADVEITFSAVIFAAAFILGIFGIVDCIKNGRLSVLCIVLDSLPLAYMLFGVVYSLIKGSGVLELYIPILLFLALYMAGAVIAFKGRKKPHR